MTRSSSRRGSPAVPESLKGQLKVGGRLVIPVGTDPRAQELVRVTRISNEEFKSEDIADVGFVPLVGKEGWAPAELPFPPRPHPTRLRPDEGDIVKATPRPRSPSTLLEGRTSTRC